MFNKTESMNNVTLALYQFRQTRIAAAQSEANCRLMISRSWQGQASMSCCERLSNKAFAEEKSTCLPSTSSRRIADWLCKVLFVMKLCYRAKQSDSPNYVLLQSKHYIVPLTIIVCSMSNLASEQIFQYIFRRASGLSKIMM